jgi:hypothetical protein
MAGLPRIKLGERGVAIGGSGTGKSELVLRLLPLRGRLLVLDPKRMFDAEYLGLNIIDDPRKFGNRSRILYRPKDSLLSDIPAYDQAVKTFYNKGECTIYSDDLVGIMDRNRYPNSLKLAYMLGRSKNVSCIASVQRPANVPTFVLSESNHFFVFKLVMPQDVKKMRELLHDYNPELIEQNRFSFQYNDMRFSEKSKLMRISIAK